MDAQSRIAKDGRYGLLLLSHLHIFCDVLQ